MRFGKVIFFPIKLFKKIYLHGKFIIEFIIEFHFLLSTIIHVPLDEFLNTENMCLPRLVMGKLQVFALHLPKFLSLEYA